MVCIVEQSFCGSNVVGWILSTFPAENSLFNPSASLFVVSILPTAVSSYTNGNTGGLSVGIYAVADGGVLPLASSLVLAPIRVRVRSMGLPAGVWPTY